MEKLWTYFGITNIVELCALAAAIMFLNRKTTVWRGFILMLFITVCVEVCGWYLSGFLGMDYNTLPFNIRMLINIAFLILFFTTAEVLSNYRKWMIAGTVVFLVGGIVNLLKFQGMWNYNFYSEAFGDLMLAFICCTFFLKSLQSDAYHDFFSDPYFWLTNGLLLVSMANALLYIFIDNIATFQRETGTYIYDPINNVINVIYYTSLIIAFICRWKTTRSS